MLAIGEVHFVGDPVAVVVAETLQQATDALGAIEVAYTPLDVVVDARAALADGAPQLHENAPNNLILSGIAERTGGREGCVRRRTDQDHAGDREPTVDSHLDRNTRFDRSVPSPAPAISPSGRPHRRRTSTGF
ncbi:MAG: hypothetical protein R2843_14490 [Thermomicrobiales bacterium]